MASGSSQSKMLKRADPSTIQNKFMVGYQGWFTCAGDGPPLDPGHHGWLHWFNYPMPDGGRPNTDLWPDVSEYSPSELYPAPGLKHANGEQAFLFSSRHPKTVQRHFHWMALHGVDGAFLQRFAGQTDLEGGNEAIRNQRDEVGDRVREAAEAEGRVFAIMYDVSGVAPDRIQRVIEHDWIHLIRDKGVLDSPNYLKEKGKPVVVFWGFGFSGSGHDPAVVRAITAFVRNNTPGGAYIMAGTPAYWRTSDSDADTNPEFVNVWLEEFDAISPWTIGRFRTADEADRFDRHNIKGDVELIQQRNEGAERGQPGCRHIDYIPVILPGGSGFNLSEGKWGWNDIARRGGQFMWRQLFNVRNRGINIIYGAMWDEYDEGTAYMPVVSYKRQLPVHEKYNFMALDEDGFDLPSDWYMRICGFTAESVRGEREVHENFPSKELQDYWSTHPKFEDNGRSGSASGATQGTSNFEKWERLDGEDGVKEEPPPPYALEGGPNLCTEKPPLPPATTRPNAVMSQSASSSSPSAFPPPLNVDSRPKIYLQPDAQTAQSINALTDDFSRQSLSTSAPSASSVGSSPYPTSQYPSPSRFSSLSSTSSPKNEYGFPQPNTYDNPAVLPSPYEPQTTAGVYPMMSMPDRPTSQRPWGQAPWPPPEWDANTSYSPSQSSVPYAVYSGRTSGHGPAGYQAATAPLLQGRPSVSSTYLPTPPQLSSYGEPYPPQSSTGDVQFPHVQPQSQFGTSPPAIPFPEYRHDSAPPPIPPRPYGNSSPGQGLGGYYDGRPAEIFHHQLPPPPPPPRPPNHPQSGLGTSNVAPSISSSSGPSGLARIASGAGRDTINQLHNLAQSAGSKIFNKQKK